MHLAVGLGIVLFAGALQGSFILPMNYTRSWEWEHNWFVFSFLGMLVLNGLIGLAMLPALFSVYAATPHTTLVLLSSLGLGWGAGAILFGLGMQRLGMSLGYPIIMGLIAVLGGLIPFLIFHPRELNSRRGWIYFAGTFLVVIGILVCSRAAARRERERATAVRLPPQSLTTGLVIAFVAGVLSSLPNLGISMSAALKQATDAYQVPLERAGNVVWVLFFGMGFIVNGCYCLWRMLALHNLKLLFRHSTPHNIGLVAAMAAAWIGSFYLYGLGTSLLRATGTILAWPLFICTSILVGNFWGLRTGEWKTSSRQAQLILRVGMAILLLSVVVIAMVNLA